MCSRPLTTVLAILAAVCAPGLAGAQDLDLSAGGVLVDTEPLALWLPPPELDADEDAQLPLTRERLRARLLDVSLDGCVHPSDGEHLAVTLWLEPPTDVLHVVVDGTRSDATRDCISGRLRHHGLTATIEAPMLVHLVVDTGTTWWPTTQFELDPYTIEASAPAAGDDAVALHRAALTDNMTVSAPSPPALQPVASAATEVALDASSACAGDTVVASFDATSDEVRLHTLAGRTPCNDAAVAGAVDVGWASLDVTLPAGPRLLVLPGAGVWPDPQPETAASIAPRTGGTLRGADIRRAVRERLPAVEACHERALLGGFDPAGTVEVWLRYDAGTGARLTSHVIGTTGLDSLHACVRDALDEMRLPLEQRDHAIEVRAFFDFVGGAP